MGSLIEVYRKLCEPVLRRTSGGGAVYHDLGNLNYSIITKDASINSICDVLETYRFFSSAISNGLGRLGIRAEFCPPNAVFLGEEKISGMAQHRFYHAILFHGTLLVDSDLESLYRVLLRSKN